MYTDTSRCNERLPKDRDVYGDKNGNDFASKIANYVQDFRWLTLSKSYFLVKMPKVYLEKFSVEYDTKN